jgi:hypothetical protein
VLIGNVRIMGKGLISGYSERCVFVCRKLEVFMAAKIQAEVFTLKWG